jgi:hypothetical protein
MRFSAIAVAVTALLMGNVALAQMNGMVVPTPTIGATSPLGSASSGSSVSPTGIPLGSTEITSAGVSPVPSNPTGTIAMPSGGMPCSTVGTSSTQTYGSGTTYDGGGISIANSVPATGVTAGGMAGSLPGAGMSVMSPTLSASGLLDTAGMSGMCGSGSNSLTASSTPTSPTVPGGNPRTGIPLGSVEIGNLGVSSSAPIPTMPVTVPGVVATPTMPVSGSQIFAPPNTVP